MFHFSEGNEYEKIDILFRIKACKTHSFLFQL